MNNAIEAPPLAHFCATVAEQQAIAIGLTRTAQIRFERVTELAAIILDATDDPATDERRIVICAEVINETAILLGEHMNQVEKALGAIDAALCGRSTDA